VLDCLADELEVAFHALAQQAVGTVLPQRAALRHCADEGRRVADVLKHFGERACISRRARAVGRVDDVGVDPMPPGIPSSTLRPNTAARASINPKYRLNRSGCAPGPKSTTKSISLRCGSNASLAAEPNTSRLCAPN
jgi:hypothetical protein